MDCVAFHTTQYVFVGGGGVVKVGRTRVWAGHRSPDPRPVTTPGPGPATYMYTASSSYRSIMPGREGASPAGGLVLI